MYMIKRFFSKLTSDCRRKYFFYGCKVVVILGLFYFFFLFNSRTPFVYDDIGYRYIHENGRSFFDVPEEAPMISCFSDVLASVKALFLSWGGRLIFFGVAHFLFMFDKFWFNVLNAFAAVAVIFMICKTAVGKTKITVWELLMTASLFFYVRHLPA